jgi:hypothetical protein
MAHFAQAGHHLGSGAGRLDALADALRDCISAVTGGNGDGSPNVASVVLRDMRCDGPLAQLNGLQRRREWRFFLLRALVEGLHES